MPYTHNQQHRNGTPNKSQWVVSLADELASFNHATAQNWFVDLWGWGLHLPGGSPAQLGTSVGNMRALFIAKFVANRNRNDNWHGYPADYCVNSQDIPKAEVLQRWLAAGVCRPAAVRKISRGKKCAL